MFLRAFYFIVLTSLLNSPQAFSSGNENFSTEECRKTVRSLQKSDKLREQEPLPVLSRSIKSLDLSTRSYNALMYEGIEYIGDLVVKTEWDLLRLPYFGKKSLREVKEVLSEWELQLGMNTAWPSDREQVEELVQSLKPEIEKQELSPFLALSVRGLNLSTRARKALEKRFNNLYWRFGWNGRKGIAHIT